MAFGAFYYIGSENLGDEIQSLAAIGRIPPPQYYLDRDGADGAADKIEGFVSVVMNGWYGQWPEKWPPSEKIRPLFVAMHITKERVGSKFNIRPNEFFLAPSMTKYLKYHAPIGARDLGTLALLQRAGIESYFSGCMTLTLERPNVQRAEDLIVLNDVPREVLMAVRERSRKHLIRSTNIDNERDMKERFNRARELLALYARASCVVTTRLHCALPCLAMGTPVLLVNTAYDQYRFAGLKELTHFCTAKDFIAGKVEYDINNPPPNKLDYLPLREGLIRRVAEFVAGDATYVPTKNPDYPTQADKDEALRYIAEQREQAAAPP